jgi:leader peptidase (prepilin peptidase) / N-methyltransferase
VSDALLVAGAAVVGGLVVGPLLNHAITWWIGWRVVVPPLLGCVPPSRSLGHARTRCAGCDAALAPARLPARPSTPLRWHCPGCHMWLPGWLGAVEAVTAALFAVTVAVVGAEWELVPALAFAAGMVAASAVDLAVMRLPTRFVWGTGGAVLAGIVLVSVVDGPFRRMEGALVGAVLLGGLFLVLHLISPRMLGFGDVRLATVVGMTVGWIGWRSDFPILSAFQATVNAGLLAGLIGAVAGLVLLVVRGRDRPFPFGPAIAAGGLVALLAAA